MPDSTTEFKIELAPGEQGFLYFDTKKANLESTSPLFRNVPINLAKETADDFVIYPGYLSDEKNINSSVTPSYFGKKLSGVTLDEYDKHIKSFLE